MTQKTILTLTTGLRVFQNLFSTLSFVAPENHFHFCLPDSTSNRLPPLVIFQPPLAPHFQVPITTCPRALGTTSHSSLVCEPQGPYTWPLPPSLSHLLPIPHQTFPIRSPLLFSLTSWFLPKNTHLLTAPKALVLGSVF